MPAEEQLDALADELAALSERLADVALGHLRAALEADEEERQAAAALERRVTRARRAVERAAAILRGGPAAETDP